MRLIVRRTGSFPNRFSLSDLSALNDLLGEVDKPKGKPGPEGKLRQVFDRAAELPLDQQKHIVRLVEDAMLAYRARKTG